MLSRRRSARRCTDRLTKRTMAEGPKRVMSTRPAGSATLGYF